MSGAPGAHLLEAPWRVGEGERGEERSAGKALSLKVVAYRSDNTTVMTVYEH